MAEFELENTFWDATVTAGRSAFCGGKLWVGGCDAEGRIRLDVIAADGTTQRIVVDSLGITGTGGDDHNSPSVIAVAGKVPYVAYTKHNLESGVRTVKGTTNADAAFIGNLPNQASIGFVSVADTVTHAYLQQIGNIIHLWTRCSNSGDNRHYGYCRSSDFGATRDIAPRLVFDSGAAGGASTYANFALAPDGQTLRAFITTETADLTNNFIAYAEINLTTGAILDGPGGSTIANLYTPTNLPVQWRTDLAVARQSPAGIHRSMRDVGAGDDPEVVWVEFDHDDPQATSTYWYGVYTGGQWITNPVCSAGRQFGQGAQGGYHGGISFTNEAPGRVLVSRRSDAGVWTIERWSTNNNGANFAQDAVIATASEPDVVALARPYQIADAPPGGYQAIYARLTRYGDDWEDPAGYRDWRGSLIVTDQ